ncbi:MAG: CvpA family protein [Bacteroidota bacterium]
MNFIDVLLVVPIIYAAWKGLKNGLIIEVFTLLALLVGLYAGIHFSDFLAAIFRDNLGWESVYAPTICFTLIFLGIGAMIYFAGVMLKRIVKVVRLSLFDKIGGLTLSVVTCLYLLSTILVLLESYDEKGGFFPEEKKESSLLYYPVKAVSTYTIPGFSESSIFIKNMFKDESDSTGLTPMQVMETKELADSLGIEIGNAQELKELHQKHNLE